MIEKDIFIKKESVYGYPATIENCELIYYSEGVDDESDRLRVAGKFIDHFDLVFPDDSVLVNEAAIIIDHVKSSGDNNVREIILNYLSGIYGMPEKNNFENWLKNKLDIELEKKD